jgi:hypothetical protein
MSTDHSLKLHHATLADGYSYVLWRSMQNS